MCESGKKKKSHQQEKEESNRTAAAVAAGLNSVISRPPPHTSTPRVCCVLCVFHDPDADKSQTEQKPEIGTTD